MPHTKLCDCGSDKPVVAYCDLCWDFVCVDCAPSHNIEVPKDAPSILFEHEAKKFFTRENLRKIGYEVFHIKSCKRT